MPRTQNILLSRAAFYTRQYLQQYFRFCQVPLDRNSDLIDIESGIVQSLPPSSKKERFQRGVSQLFGKTGEANM